MLAAFSAAVEGPLVMRFTRVTFGGMDFDFHEIGMEPRHSWWGVRWFTVTYSVISHHMGWSGYAVITRFGELERVMMERKFEKKTLEI